MYLIYSEDIFLLKKSIDKLINNLNKDDQFEVYNFNLSEDKLEIIYNEINTFSMFGNNKIIVINECWFLTEIKEQIIRKDFKIEIIEKILNSKTNNEIIFSLNNDKLSERLKITKSFKEKCEVEKIELLDDSTVSRFIKMLVEKAGKKIETDEINYIKSLLPLELEVIKNEVSKLTLLNIETITKEAIDQNIVNYLEFDVFNISKSFLENDQANFIKEYRNFLEKNDSTISIIPLISENITTIRNILILKKQGKNQSDIVERLKIHPYRVKLAYNYRYEIDSMNEKLFALYKIMKSITSSKMDNKILPEYELVKAMRG